MIQISDTSVDINTLDQELPASSLQRKILNRLAESQIVYNYPSLSLLKFEIKLRSSTVSAARRLAVSGSEFAVFDKSKCNAAYWTRTDEGGFLLNQTATPSAGINDIFKSGWKYAFECTTSIVIVYYKALIDTIGAESFNNHFASLYLFDGTYDKHLHLIKTFAGQSDYLPGDALYFKNPEYNPETPEWQGENVILLDNDTYFAHGIGIKTKKGVIASLNQYRFAGATVSAFLVDEAVRPDFAYLAQFDLITGERSAGVIADGNTLVYAQIGPVIQIRP
ncbi:protein-glutamine gamma-glutamyltransferase [Aneurinibacillus sp. Ricciae_BoGa-3]|uniref:protein-glutamine gamma-glutamyltransferase n=1 Tax=Aneurinibacillus sp. Ricciae_BoGa-3 TaxID=3022697 RepID=UPI0023417AB1|nr:protein-glutamine gamma-glutamyltransferase [Aneurinibacillus sp. Ricciae_BoGa-3]WCK56597.1 protein-glutamine gamma-glutamyltransferase [Aneurinibacillus sp. Ricciae_BoGa-3]